jgi:hypothetical protein
MQSVLGSLLVGVGSMAFSKGAHCRSGYSNEVDAVDDRDNGILCCLLADCFCWQLLLLCSDNENFINLRFTNACGLALLMQLLLVLLPYHFIVIIIIIVSVR